MNKDKLQRILHSLSNQSSGMGDAFKSVEKEMEKVVNKLREETEAKTVVEAKKKIKELKEEMSAAISSLANEIENLKNDLDKNDKNLLNSVNTRFSKLSQAIVDFKNANTEHIKQLAGEIEKLKIEEPVGAPDFKGLIDSTETTFSKMISEVKEESDLIKEKSVALSEDFDKKIDEIDEKIQKVHLEALSALSRGGSANRQINLNSSVMSTRYTDINFQQSGNVGWSAVNDDDNKRVNIRASILVGGGGSINLIENEVPSMISGTQFAIDNVASVGTVRFYEGARRLTPTTDFTVSGSVVTLTYTPPTESDKLVDYRF